MNTIYLVNLKREEYSTVLALQKALVQAKKNGSFPDVLLILEHNPVITVGMGGGLANLLVPARELDVKGISLHRTERGGNITYHGPGQLVVYPIINLLKYQTDLHWYVRQLENMVVNLLAQYGLTASAETGRTGVWIGDEKIAAIGVAVRKWISYHGLALNVNNDLTPFKYIVPCGLQGFGVTSLRDVLGYEVSMAEVREGLCLNFCKTFEVSLSEISLETLFELFSIELTTYDFLTMHP